MREKLVALSNLHKLDLEVASLRKAAEVYPRQIAELDREFTVAKAAVEAERNKLADIDRQRSTLEQNIAEEKDKIRKWEARLSEQRSTREYAALAREIDIAKRANLTMGEQLAELGKQGSAARDGLKLKEEEFGGRKTQFESRLSELKQAAVTAEDQVKTLEAQRGALSALCDGNLLRRYEAVRKKKLPAMAAVLAPGTCQGCNMNVRPQLYNNLRTSLGTDVCPSCSRIIYAAEALEAPAPK